MRIKGRKEEYLGIDEAPGFVDRASEPIAESIDE